MPCWSKKNFADIVDRSPTTRWSGACRGATWGRGSSVVDFARDAICPLNEYLDEAAEILTAGRGARGRRRVLLRRTLRHALAFSTWRSLSSNGIERSDAVRLSAGLVETAVG